MTEEITLSPREAGAVFGEYDVFLKKIEEEMNIVLIARDGRYTVSGEEDDVKRAADLFELLKKEHKDDSPLDEQTLVYAIGRIKESDTVGSSKVAEEMEKLGDDVIIQTTTGRPVFPKTFGQKAYVDSIRQNMITFGIGPAGTGKTYLAMAMAIAAFRNDEVQRIILTRPAIEAGEKLGFLPGDLQSKIDPFLRPLYDALYTIMGADSFLKNQEKGLIEVAPLAYMRGRTLDNAFVILDEAQNTTPSQMKMFLTRLGFGTKAVITGDRTQKDLPAEQESGLDVATKVLRDIPDIGFAELRSRDVIRHPLVMKIVEAYEKYEASKGPGKGDKKIARGVQYDRLQHRDHRQGR